MPLDTNKTAHIQAVILRTFQNRQKNVVFIYQISGLYTYSVMPVILRPQSVIDPQIPDSSGNQPRPQYDTLMIVPITTNLSGVVYIADTTTPNATAIAAAPKYEIVEALPTGIIPGGTHYTVKLRRLR